MCRRKYFLTAGFLFCVAIISFAGQEKVFAKSVTSLQEKLPGIYPDPYYVINDPGCRDDVIKIAVIRDTVTTGIDNKYSPLPPICGLLPIPVWNNGEFVYHAKGHHQLSRTDTPLDMLHNRTFTLVVENPADITDYDIVIRETYAANSRGNESQHMFTFLYFQHKKLIPSTRMDVSSAVTDINFNYETGPMETDRLNVFLIPLKNRNTEKTARLLFTEKLYKEIVMNVKDPEQAIRARKRHYIFQKDPTLQQLENELLSSLTSPSCKEKLTQYKERMDYIEHMRCLAEIRDISQTPAPKYGNRVALSLGLLDVTYGRNYDLYHPSLRTAMLETFDIRQQTIEELRALNDHFSSYINPNELYDLEALCLRHYRAYFNQHFPMLSAASQ